MINWEARATFLLDLIDPKSDVHLREIEYMPPDENSPDRGWACCYLEWDDGEGQKFYEAETAGLDRQALFWEALDRAAKDHTG